MSEPEESAPGSSIHDRVVGESSSETPATTDLANADKDEGGDNESTFSDLSDPDTDDLLSIRSNKEDNSDGQARPLGLSRPWGFSDYDDYEWVAHHYLFLTMN